MIKHIPLLLILTGCNLNSIDHTSNTLDSRETHQTEKHSTNQFKDPKESRLTVLDTVYLIEDPDMMYWELRNDYNEVVTNQDEFFNLPVLEPYESYIKHTHYDSENTRYFSSEYGIDAYFAYYTYFLKKRYNSEKYNSQRNRLVKIHRILNLFYSNAVLGGSAFVHYKVRLFGHIEWDLFQYDKRAIAEQNMSKACTSTDIEEYKQFNEETLNKAYHSKHWVNMPDREKRGRIEILRKLLDELYPLITNEFELETAMTIQTRGNSVHLEE